MLSDVVLICEGACNSPTIGRIDAAIEASLHRDTNTLSYPQKRGSLAVWNAYRRVKYTPHVLVGGNRARCWDCRTERQWGGPVV